MKNPVSNIRIALIFFSLLLTLFLSNCDTNKFITSNLGTASASDSTLLFGNVTRQDNGNRIVNARLQLTFHVAFSDSLGYYSLPIIYSDDYNRNLDPTIVVSAKNFESYIGPVQILPIPKKEDFVLVWSPPLIYQNALLVVKDDPSQLTGPVYIQAIMKDFQGVETIVKVEAQFTLNDEPFIWPLYLVRTVDEYTAHYESPILFEPISISLNKIFYRIIVEDTDGNKWEEIYISFLERPESPLF